jgi:hypothetical protein
MATWSRELWERGIQILGAGGSRLSPFALDAHSRVHQGRMYKCSFVLAAVADDTAVDLILSTPANDYPHLTVAPQVGGDAEFQIFEGTAFSGGSALDIFNMKRTSDNTFGGNAVRSPTINSLGTQLHHSFLPGGANVLSTPGVAVNFDREFILNSEMDYHFRVTNRSGGATFVGITLIFYSAPLLADDNDS